MKQNGKHETSPAGLRAARRDNQVAAAFAGIGRDEGHLLRQYHLVPKASIPQPAITLRVDLPLVTGGFVKRQPFYTEGQISEYATSEIERAWGAALEEAAKIAERTPEGQSEDKQQWFYGAESAQAIRALALKLAQR